MLKLKRRDRSYAQYGSPSKASFFHSLVQLIAMRSCRHRRCKLRRVSSCPQRILEKELTDKVEAAAGVAPLVVVPGNELDEVLVQLDTSRGIEDRRVRVAVEVRGDESVLGVREDA